MAMTLLNREDMIKIIETCEVKGQDEAIVRALMYLTWAIRSCSMAPRVTARRPSQSTF